MDRQTFAILESLSRLKNVLFCIIYYHVRVDTHVISLILNLGQNVEEDWPLFLRDHEGEDHVVMMAPGDMVWYESASVLHGRQLPLMGTNYDNLFVHFKPNCRSWYR